MLQKLIDEDFVGSGLDFKTLEKEGYVRPVPADEMNKTVPASHKGQALGGVEFRYFEFDDENNAVPFDHARYKTYWKELTGFAAKVKDTRPKYIQPAATRNFLYIPPVVSWSEVLEDASQTVAITEGEKKTLALNLRGIPTAGLGGVGSIGNKKRGQVLIPELKKICEGGRNILIVFDIDAGHTTLKPEVARAAFTLANHILEYGGVPKIVTLPSDGRQKCAVDDWLLTNDFAGFELYNELVQYAKPLDTAASLYSEAGKYVYVTDSNALGRIDTREAVLVSDYRVSSGNVQVVTQELVIRRVKNAPPVVSTEIVVRPLAEAFLKWGSRPTAKGTAYEPGNYHYLTPAGEFNQWKGWAQPLPEGHVARESDVRPLRDAMEALYGSDAEMMWNWFLYPIARPGAKWVIVPVIKSEAEGVGKSSIPEFFSKFVYGEGPGTPNNATTLNAMSLKDGRLEFMVRKQFLFLDDANDIHGNDVEALLKNLATSGSVRANPKYLRSYECKNTINLCITTNRTMPFKVPVTDRRLFFPHVASDVPKSVWHELHKWGRAGGGAKVVAYAQQLFDADAVDPFMKAPMTRAKEEVIGVARSGFESFLHDLCDAASEGYLARVLFTGRELKILAEQEGEIRSAHDIGPATMNRNIKMSGAVQYGGSSHRVQVGSSKETIYIFAEAERWLREPPGTVIAELARVPIDRVRLTKPRAPSATKPEKGAKPEKVVAIAGKKARKF